MHEKGKYVSYFSDKSVVVLGGAGFIGTHLVEALYDRVHSLSAVDLIWGTDLRDFNKCMRAMDGRDIVFNLASRVGGRGFLDSNKAQLWNNLELDATILRAASLCNIQKMVHFSSACVYPNVNIPFFDEEMTEFGGIEKADGVYGKEKLISENMLRDYSEQYFFSGISVRPFTVYGPGMKENRSIGALIAKTFIKQDPFEVWGSGNQKTDWIYINDLIDGVLLATEKMDSGVVNIGTGIAHTPMDVLEMIWNYVGWRPNKIFYNSTRPTSPKKIADNTKLYSLGWSRKFDLEQGLWDTIDWYYLTHKEKDVRESFERKLLEA